MTGLAGLESEESPLLSLYFFLLSSLDAVDVLFFIRLMIND